MNHLHPLYLQPLFPEEISAFLKQFFTVFEVTTYHDLTKTRMVSRMLIFGNVSPGLMYLMWRLTTLVR